MKRKDITRASKDYHNYSDSADQVEDPDIKEYFQQIADEQKEKFNWLLEIRRLLRKK